MSEPLNVKHTIGDKYRKVYSYFKPVANFSSFVKSGTLTPAEFVDAGDFLVYKFKTWEWQEADKNRTVSYLPEGKQFLITRNVPCKYRVKDLNYIAHDLEIVENDWLLPNYDEDNSATDVDECVCVPGVPINTVMKEENVSRKRKGGRKRKKIQLFRSLHEYTFQYVQRHENYDNYDDDDEAVDINHFDIDNDVIKENDLAAIDNPGFCQKNAQNENVMNIRTYDVSITYDKYYETPRIWLFGYDENGNPLRSEEIFEDVLAEYSYKTVTYDPHPCTGVMTASIHPCRHAEVMLNVVKNWISEEKEPRHDLYLLFLLKFISGVIPTIEYDFTTDIELPREDRK
ncbi:autophagy-related protein 3, putative [Plasmodium ovale]|uniref:Autophagy-related protein 3, putative n=1 Tax=Plasmodium ovale TaxID=36330 RepID=A0A1D3U7E1_PLAOA|nr:autophagy-related protein 3, putative [Plasmodium ovale]